MLTHVGSFSSFSVDDIATSLDFYRNKLGLTVNEMPQGLQVVFPNGHTVFLYQKDAHEAATFTVLNFVVADASKAVAELKAAGVEMLQYDLPGIQTDENGIARSSEGPTAMGWFTDPSGNILAVMQE